VPVPVDATPDAAPPPLDAAFGPNDPAHLEALVDAYEAGELDAEGFRAALRGIEDDGRPAVLPAAIEQTRLLKPRAEPYTLDGEARVAVGAILVIEAGAMVQLAPGAHLIINGRLYAIGSDEDPIIIAGDAGQPYDSVALRGGPNALHRTHFSGGDRLLVSSHPTNVRTRISRARFDEWVDVAIDLAGTANFSIQDSVLGIDSPPEFGGEIIRARRAAAIDIEGNLFGARRGYRDAIDLQDCTAGEPWPRVNHNVFLGGEDDAIDLDRCSAFVDGNHIRGFRPLDLDRMQQGINGGGITGDGDIDLVITDNLIEGCYHGIGFKNGARPVLINNTIIGGNIGVSLYQSAVGNPAPHGVMINNVLADNLDFVTGAPQDVVLNGRWWRSYNQRDEVQATLDAHDNIFASGGAVPEGERNRADDPMLRRVDDLPVPGEGSPARDAGDPAPYAGPAPIETVIEMLSTDFAGHPRHREGDGFPGIDLGAIEAP
ncbi:MAG: right-handed parallel beta-helix repeat-containing protein, partial [Myxococcales bacterium]|nr:right-handed parallel beta-helix repeat-containing protein [Myxococcales bacterium]